MSLEIPDYYFEEVFRRNAKDVTVNSSGVMNGGCPMCMEGNSWGKKRRLYYYPETKYATCFNCGESISQINFILRFEGITFRELVAQLSDEIEDFNTFNRMKGDVITLHEDNTPSKIKLPPDAIDLFNETQVEFYKDEWAVKLAISTIKKRRLDTAKYRSNLYLSLNDFTHKNRIIIPFRDESGDIYFYQSRAQTESQEKLAKYLSSLDSKKIFYGLDKIDYNRPFIFILEGPLDCFFVGNSIGGGGLKLNKLQREKVDSLDMLFNNGVIFCYDNDFDNPDVVDAYINAVKKGYKVFLWDGVFSKYKDFNEYAVGEKVNCVDELEIIKHCKSGKEAIKSIIEKSGRGKKPTTAPRLNFFDD